MAAFAMRARLSRSEDRTVERSQIQNLSITHASINALSPWEFVYALGYNLYAYLTVLRALDYKTQEMVFGS